MGARRRYRQYVYEVLDEARLLACHTPQSELGELIRTQFQSGGDLALAEALASRLYALPKTEAIRWFLPNSKERTLLRDPLAGVTARLLTPHQIAWEAFTPPGRCEQSPLLEALFAAVEDTRLRPGEGAVHVHVARDGAQQVVWRCGDNPFAPIEGAA